MNFDQCGWKRHRMRAYPPVRVAWWARLPGWGFQTDHCAEYGPYPRQVPRGLSGR